MVEFAWCNRFVNVNKTVIVGWKQSIFNNQIEGLSRKITMQISDTHALREKMLLVYLFAQRQNIWSLLSIRKIVHLNQFAEIVILIKPFLYSWFHNNLHFGIIWSYRKNIPLIQCFFDVFDEGWTHWRDILEQIIQNTLIFFVFLY